jgi:hypothetical protein
VKVYHVCDICQRIFNVSEQEGYEGSMAMQGMCEECLQEMGFADNSSPSQQFFYN